MVAPDDVLSLNYLDAKRQRIIEVESFISSLHEIDKQNLIFPSQEENLTYEEGLAKIRENEYKTALKKFKACQESYPNSILAKICQYWIGLCYFHLGDYRQAIVYFQMVISDSRSPRYEETLIFIAWCLESILDYSGAQVYYNRLLRERADSAYVDIVFRRLVTLRSKLSKFDNYN